MKDSIFEKTYFNANMEDVIYERDGYVFSCDFKYRVKGTPRNNGHSGKRELTTSFEMTFDSLDDFVFKIVKNFNNPKLEYYGFENSFIGRHFKKVQ